MAISAIGSLYKKAFRFIKNTAGSTAAEFAIVLIPFLMLILSIIEVGLLYMTSASVDGAVMNAARMIRTGQVQLNDMTKNDLKDIICEGLGTVSSCAARVSVEVKNFSSFPDLTRGETTCADGDSGSLDFKPGDAGDVVMVRVCLLYDVMTPGLGINLANTGENQRAVVSSMIFRNEPFDFAST